MAEDGFSREFILANPHGLHLRPASQFVSVANRYSSQVYVSVDGGEEGNGKSILDLSCRAAEKGAVLRVRVVGEDAEDALSELAELVEGGFGEMEGD